MLTRVVTCSWLEMVVATFDFSTHSAECSTPRKLGISLRMSDQHSTCRSSFSRIFKWCGSFKTYTMTQRIWKPINIYLSRIWLSHYSLISHHVIKVFSLCAHWSLNLWPLIFRVAPDGLISLPFFVLDLNSELLFGFLQLTQYCRIIPHLI